MTTWARPLGERRRRRDAETRFQAKALLDADDARQIASLRRWPGIVTAIRALAKVYNEGAGLDAITVVEHAEGDRPGLTVASVGSDEHGLEIVLDGTELQVRARGEQPTTASGERWIDLARSDEDTAAYVLQDWMARL